MGIMQEHPSPPRTPIPRTPLKLFCMCVFIIHVLWHIAFNQGGQNTPKVRIYFEVLHKRKRQQTSKLGPDHLHIDEAHYITLHLISEALVLVTANDLN